MTPLALLPRPLSGAVPGAAWIAARSRPLRLLLLAALGGLGALGLPPFDQPWLAVAALVLIMALAARGAAGFGEGWAFGAGWFAVALRWMVEPFLVEPARTGWMAPFALLLAAGGFALFWGAAFGLARRLRLGMAGWVALWAGAEALRSLVLSGFPWALVGHVWTATPLVQLVAFVGVHGLTLGTLAAAAVVASPRAGAWRLGPPALVALAWVAMDPGPAPAPDPAAPLVRLVQPNVPQDEKWDPAFMPGAFERLMELSGGESRADLVVWPETALTELLDPRSSSLRVARAATGGAPLAFGVARRDEAGRYFNSLAVMDAEGRVSAPYDKAHLVPFGEFMPLQGLMARVGLRALAEFQGVGFTPGPGPALVEVPGIGPVRPLICYEGIFAEEVGTALRPRALMLVTNDAWFGERAGPVQHFELGRLRAIEQGLPLLRSANTGISAMIDGKGRVLASLPLHEAGAVEARLPPALAPTVYARLGDRPAFGAILLLLGLGFWRRRPVPRVDPGVARP